MNRPTKTVVFIVSILLLSGLAYGGWRLFFLSPPLRAAETYMEALAAGDVEKAVHYSSGNAAFLAERVKQTHPKAKVRGISSSVIGMGHSWAAVLVTVELKLADGAIDVGWYTVDTVRSEEGWKVIAAREREPEMTGTSLWEAGSKDEIKTVFEEYMKALVSGDWGKAGSFLVGPAKRKHDLSTEALSKSPVVKSFSDSECKLLFKKRNEVVVQMSYRADGRPVAVLVYGIYTSEGWRIADIFVT
jgi:hypothetical protein